MEVIKKAGAARTKGTRKALISLIVPTRGRPENMKRFSQSLLANTARPDQVELILVIDDDDRSYDDMTFDGLWVRRVRGPSGRAMGELNMAGYRVCSGDYIMLLNDDVVIRSAGWDDTVLSVFNAHPDKVVLVHVNDRLFESRLCTFPFVSRLFCEMSGGVCQPDYHRYRIDDHIYEVFNLLSVLGHDRIVYLQEVVFEHLNFVTDGTGKIEYQPDPEIHAADTKRFAGYRPKRKALVLELADIIDKHRRQQQRLIHQLLLEPNFDTNELRRQDRVHFYSSSTKLNSRQARVTIGVVSADIRGKNAQACLRAIKAFTTNFDLIILDNNRGPNFNHPREMNRILSICRTDFLVLMDDDVIVEAGWLDGLLSGIGSDVGVVTPLHKSVDGKLSYAGVVMCPDYSGNHTHAFALYSTAFPIQTLCSAIMLIDMNKCGHLYVDESYSKYFLDIDYGLRVWEAGFQVVCAPNVIVTHIGGGTLSWSTQESIDLVKAQRLHFVNSWIDTGRYTAIENSSHWQNAAEIQAILDLPKKLPSFLEPASDVSPDRALVEAHAFVEQLDQYPAVRSWVADIAMAAQRGRPADFGQPLDRKYAALVGQFDVPIQIEVLDDQTVVYLWRGNYYELPKRWQFNASKASAGEYRSAARLDLIRAHVYRDTGDEPSFDIQPAASLLIEEGYKGFNLVQSAQIYAVPQRDGDFDPGHAARNLYFVHSESLDAVKGQIDSLEPLLIEEGYRGFNLVRFDRIYALVQGEGAFDPAAAFQGAYRIQGENIENVKAQIDKLQPTLLESGYKGFNLVLFGNVYAFAQGAGVFDPASETQIRYSIRGQSVDSVKAQINDLRLVLVEEGYRGFNLVRRYERIYAVAQASGAFDAAAAARGSYPIHGFSVEDVKAQVDALQPILLEEGYKGFNLVGFDRIYALVQSESAFDPKRAVRGGYEIHGESIDAVRAQIDALQPVIIHEDYKGFMLVRFGSVYGLARGRASFDIKAAAEGAYFIRGDTIDAVKEQIDALQPVLLEENYHGFNLVRFDEIYAVPQCGRDFDSERAVQGGYEIRGVNITAVKAQIKALQPG